MVNINLQVIADPMSLNIDENKLQISASPELDCICINFKVNDQLCGIMINKKDFKESIKFLEDQFNEDF